VNFYEHVRAAVNHQQADSAPCDIAAEEKVLQNYGEGNTQ